MREEIRRKKGIEEKPEEAATQRLKEEAADLYDTFNMRVDRHWSEKKLEEMTERDWRTFRKDFNISYKGSKIPRPMWSWSESKLSAELLKAVDRAGYKKPSPFQTAAIPLGMQQRDATSLGLLRLVLVVGDLDAMPLERGKTCGSREKQQKQKKKKKKKAKGGCKE